MRVTSDMMVQRVPPGCAAVESPPLRYLRGVQKSSKYETTRDRDRQSPPDLAGGEFVAELVALGGEIAGVVGIGRGNDGNLVDDLEIEAVVDKRVDLFGIVGEQSDLAKAEVFEDLNADAVVAHVCLVAEGPIGFDGVEAFFLQLVGFDFFDEADAAAFLR